jgi:hypothetical protein
MADSPGRKIVCFKLSAEPEDRQVERKAVAVAPYCWCLVRPDSLDSKRVLNTRVYVPRPFQIS